MERVVYFEAASGASGDMLLGALVDLGLPLDALRAELAKLPVSGYRLEARRVDRSGLQATKVDVLLDSGAHAHGHTHAPGHSHTHTHDGPAHRGLRAILALLEQSTLSDDVKTRSARLFRRLAEAEAAVHGSAPEDVHFHEVGALDSIVDIVGCVWGLGTLAAARFVCSPLNLGSGTVTMAHGIFPVPAPATLRLVQGVPVYADGAGELLTPTGALVLTDFATSYGPLPSLRPIAWGHGAGTRDTPGRPNVLRVLVGTDDGAADAPGREQLLRLEADLDDMSPQLLGALREQLMAAGALDVVYTPLQMKKGRPGVELGVLARPEQREALEELLFTESTTLGVRAAEYTRTSLERTQVEVATAYGPLRVKIGRRAGRVYNAQPEFDDCQRAAAAHGVPVKEVWAAALASWRRQTGCP
jgi:hypothetical protein